jgi:serine/threonine-protein kinase
LARAYGRAGRRTDALHIIEELKRRERESYVPPAPFVHAYIGLGDRDRAFASLERAYHEHSNIVQFVKTHPLYDPLRDDPRFAELVRRVGLE